MDKNKKKIAINGFGRIGRAFFKEALNDSSLNVVAINDLGDIENLAYLLKYDSVYGKFDRQVEVVDDGLLIDGKTVKFLSVKDPEQLPWAEMEIDIALESTGLFTTFQDASAHIKAGAKRVVLSAPAKGEKPEDVDGETVLMGVNEDKLKTCKVSSNASCTTNASSPLIAVLDEAIGVEKAILNTVHGYTSSQSLIDSPNKKFRSGRAAAQNIIPSSTGAAIAVTKAFTSLDGRFDGVAIRVPVVSGSLVDVTFVAKKNVTVDEVNQAMKDAAESSRWQGIFSVTEEPLVSTDILGSKFGSIADLDMTRVVDGNLVKVMAWYDNETGYASTLLSHVLKAGEDL